LLITEQQKFDRVIRTKLRDLCIRARSDAKLFAVLTVLLTPVAVALFILILLFALAFVDLPVVDHLGYRLSFVTGVNICLGFMVASYFLRPKEQYQRQDDDTNWLWVACGLFCGIVAMSYATTLAQTHPEWFWPLYVLLSLAMLGCVGHAYEPKDDYYLGWTAGPLLMDDPFTIQDDIDRAHIGLGFAVSVSHLILDSYGAIFGSRWLWHGLQESELSACVKLLQGLAARDVSELKAHVRELGKGSAANSVRALVKLDLVVIDKGLPRLSMKGREFLDLGAISGGQAPN